MNFIKEKGVTLIALVVTIAVLLILAGISTKLIIGDNGLIKKAQNVENATDTEAEEYTKELQNMHDSMVELNK